MSYIQTRNREDIEGIYENYFTHYIQCDLATFRTKCLYVQVITKAIDCVRKILKINDHITNQTKFAASNELNDYETADKY